MHNALSTQINPVICALWHGTFEAGEVEANRRLYNHEFVFFRKGKGRVIIGGEVFECVPGITLIIPPNLAHCTIADTQIERWCVHFDWEPGQEVPFPPYEYSNESIFFPVEKCNLTPGWVPFELPLVRLIANYNAIFEIIRQMFDPVNDTLESGIRRKGLFLQALPFCLNKPASVKSCMSPVLLKAKEYMDTNFKDPGLNITKIAASNCVTSNHLCRVFNRELGISPLSYLNSRRIKQAQELLLTTAMNVAQIAFEAGFNDPNYFSRVFKNKTGISPSCFALSRQRNSVHKLDS